MKASRLKGMSIVSISQAQKVGTATDVILNPDARRVVGIRMKTLVEDTARVIPAEQVTVGRDAITIQDDRVPQEERIPEGERTTSLNTLLGSKVLTRSGNLLGTVAEVEIDPSDMRITSYVLNTGILSGLTGSGKKVPAEMDVHYGRDILVVPDEVDTEPKQRRAA